MTKNESLLVTLVVSSVSISYSGSCFSWFSSLQLVIFSIEPKSGLFILYLNKEVRFGDAPFGGHSDLACTIFFAAHIQIDVVISIL
jgi:hypothetical protein